MKNLIKIIYFIILSIITYSIVSYTHATVGGPTYIGNFSYNRDDSSIYYIKQSYSGKGCPPELVKISLTTQTISDVISCNQAERFIDDIQALNTEIEVITQNFKQLSQFNLKNNNIRIDLDFSNSERLDGITDDSIIKRNYIANVYQGDKKVGEFSISGCKLDQPFNFAGYSIPGLEKKIAIVSSRIGDCWEGGYIYENIYIINIVDKIDRTPVLGTGKNELEELKTNAGTLTVYPNKNDTNIVSSNTDNNQTPISNELSGNNNLALILMAIVILLVGIIIGNRFKK